MTAPIILTATMGAADFAWADGLRRAHFPSERNHVPAHITLFHHLPPSVEDELVACMKAECAAPPPSARLTGVMLLGRGVAYRVESTALSDIRARLADRFAGVVIPQDQAVMRGHLTVQNKVEPQQARALADALRAEFTPRALIIAGLAAWRYLGGPWEAIREIRFRG